MLAKIREQGTSASQGTLLLCLLTARTPRMEQKALSELCNGVRELFNPGTGTGTSAGTGVSLKQSSSSTAVKGVNSVESMAKGGAVWTPQLSWNVLSQTNLTQSGSNLLSPAALDLALRRFIGSSLMTAGKFRAMS